MQDYKPAGYSTVSAYLVSTDAAASIAFMETVLGARTLDKLIEPETDRIIHASLAIEDSVIMIGGAMQDWPAQPAHVHIYVPDVDAAYSKAISFGARSVAEPAQKAGDQDKRGGVMDAGGTTWWLSTHNA